MDINTKFDFGQRVQAIVRGAECVRNNCELCNGSGDIWLNSKRHIACPDCYGRGYVDSWKDTAWYVPKDDYCNFVIQKIAMEQYNPNNKSFSGNKSWIYYMNGSSGTMFDENDLFTSKEEAQKECDKRNSK